MRNNTHSFKMSHVKDDTDASIYQNSVFDWGSNNSLYGLDDHGDNYDESGKYDSMNFVVFIFSALFFHFASYIIYLYNLNSLSLSSFSFFK